MEHLQMINYLELSYIIMKESISFSQFQEFFHLSQYRFKSDCEKLFEMAPFFGIALDMNQETIKYKIINMSIFEEKKKLCSTLYTRYYNILPSNTLVIDTVLALNLLNTKDYVTVSELADQLGYSKSNIRSRIKWARDFLEGFHIETKSIPHHGIQVSSNEFYKRLCMISLNGMVNTSLLIGFEEKMVILRCEPLFLNKIDDILKSIFKSSSLLGASMNYDMLKNYLIVTNHRLEDHFYIQDFSEFDTTSILQTHDYQLSKKIFEQLYETQYENEIIALTIYQIILKEYNFVQSMETLNFTNRFSNQVEDIYTTLTDFLYQNYHLSFQGYSYEDALKNALMKLVIKDYFKVLSAKSFSIVGKRYASAKNPLANKIMQDIKICLSQKFSCELHNSQLREIINIFERYIQTQKITYQKLDIVILTKINVSDAFLLQDLIKHTLPEKYYHMIRLKHLNTELEETLSEECVVVTDNEAYRDTKNRKIYFLDEHDNSTESLIHYLREARNLCNFHLTNFESLQMYVDDVPTLWEVAMDTLSISLQECKQNTVICNDVFFIIHNNTDQKENQLQLIHLENELQIKKSKCNYAIFLSFYSNNNTIYLFDLILKLFANHKDYLIELFHTPNITKLNHYLNQMYDG